MPLVGGHESWQAFFIERYMENYPNLSNDQLDLMIQIGGGNV